MSEPSKEPGYSIGAVTRYTGLSAHTLRVWERRYPDFKISRTESGRRLYSEEDIKRLSLMKKLIGAGHKVSELVSLATAQLESMSVLPSSARLQAGRPRIAVWGEWLPGAVEKDRQVLAGLDVVLSTDSIAELTDRLSVERVDNLILDMATIERKNLRFFRNMQEHVPAGRLIVVYHYAHREIVEELRALRVQLLRAPIDIGQLLPCVGSPVDTGVVAAGQPDSAAPPHQFSRRQLSRLSKVSTAIDCECPQHLASLIVSLSAFESYSQQCEIRNKEDSVLHSDIYKTTARARYMMESMLSRVIEAEGIELE